MAVLTHSFTRPLRRRRAARLNSPRSKWTVKLSQFMRNLTRPLRHRLRVRLHPARKKWNNRSSVQRLSYGLLALGVVMVVVGATVIVPNVGRVATSSFNAVQSRVQTAQGGSLPQLDSAEILAARCDDPAIRQTITEVIPDLKRAGMICTPRWLTLQVPTAEGPDPYVIAHARSQVDGSWELVAVVTRDGQAEFGDSSLVPVGIMTRAQTFASWDADQAGGS